MPINPPVWTPATIAAIHTASTLRDFGLVGGFSLTAGSVFRFGHGRAAAETTAEESAVAHVDATPRA